MIGRWMSRENNQSLILISFNPSVFCMYFSACFWSVRLSESTPSPPTPFSKMGGVRRRRRWGMFSTRMTLAKVWWFEASGNINNNREINKLWCPGLGVRTQGWRRREDSGGYNCLVGGGGEAWVRCAPEDRGKQGGENGWGFRAVAAAVGVSAPFP